MHEGRKPLMDKRSRFIFAVHEEDKYLIMLLKITAIFLFLTVSDDELKYKELEFKFISSSLYCELISAPEILLIKFNFNYYKK